MTGRNWFRRDVIIPLLFLGGFGYGLYFVWQKIAEQPELSESRFLSYIMIICIIAYILLAFVTLRHAAASYSLERFNPGNPQSINRLMKMRRFGLNRGIAARMQGWAAPADEIGQWLSSSGFAPAARTPHGRVFEKPRLLRLPGHARPCDRIFMLEHSLLNVLVVDQLLRDSIKYIRQRSDAPSPRNLLILVMDRDDMVEAASAAAGVVNFLGKFDGGTLGVILLDIRHGRLYYPIDRSLQPRSHRRFQDLMRIRLLHYLSKSSQQVRKSEPPIPGERVAVRRFEPEAGRAEQSVDLAYDDQTSEVDVPDIKDKE